LDELDATLEHALPLDPFTQEPLRYRKTENGYLVYSVNANGRDDGGQHWARPDGGGDPRKFDIVLSIERSTTK
jgi:hypothetical protein